MKPHLIIRNAEELPMRQPVLPLPEYRPGEYGDWVLETTEQKRQRQGLKPVPYVVDVGYFAPKGREPHYHCLSKPDENGRLKTWMVTSHLEQESHLPHLWSASGVAVVVGVGMGMILKALAEKPEVTKIYAVEIDPDIVGMIRYGTDFDQWPGGDKIEFVVADALKEGWWEEGLHPDFLYVDIWPTLGTEEAVSDVQAIQRMVRAKMVGWWGQEIDFFSWCTKDPHAEPRLRKNPKQVVPGKKLLTPAKVDWDRFQLAMNLPMMPEGRKSSYRLMCSMAAHNFAFGMEQGEA